MRDLVLIGLLLLPVDQGVADQQCYPFDQVRRSLSATYHEEVVTAGMMGGGPNAMVILVSPAGTWTALVVRPDGTACMLAEGDTYTERPRGRDL